MMEDIREQIGLERPDCFDFVLDDIPNPQRQFMLAYIVRLERALSHIARSTLARGLELFPVGPAHTEYEADGNTLKEIIPPWHFLHGTGETFLGAIEADIESITHE